MEILNRDPNFKRDICQRVMSDGKICDITKDDVLKLGIPFEELRKSDKSVFNVQDLRAAGEIVRQREIARKRVLKKEENGGYILIGSLTCMGTLAVGTIIFMAIKLIIMG